MLLTKGTQAQQRSKREQKEKEKQRESCLGTRRNEEREKARTHPRDPRTAAWTIGNGERPAEERRERQKYRAEKANREIGQAATNSCKDGRTTEGR
jgi:hypothetical protein